MFHTIVLRSTLACWTAFKRIKEHEHLSRFVRTLIYDINSWRVGTDVRDWHEWTRYARHQANHYALVDIDAAQAALYRELAESRHLWEAYLLRLDEEKAVAYEIGFGDLRLPNVRKVHVVRGAYRLENHRVSLLHGNAKLPVTAPLSTWRGDSFSPAPNVSMLIPILSHQFVATGITKWRIDGLREQDLNCVLIKNHVRNSGVTSFKIRYGPPQSGSTTGAFSHRLHQFDKMPNLESLELHSYYCTLVAGNAREVLPTMQDLFGIVRPPAAVQRELLTWQRLRKLSLRCFSSTPGEFLSLVTRHSSTLRDLRLHAMLLRHKLSAKDEAAAPSSWQQVFRSFATFTKLDQLQLSGLFRNDSIENDDWDFDAGALGDHVAAWIMKGEQRSQREEFFLIMRSYYKSHD